MIVRVYQNPPERKVYEPVRLVERLSLRQSMTQAERDRIARIAANIPDKPEPPPERIEVKWRSPFAKRLVQAVLEKAEISEQDWLASPRYGFVTAVSAVIAVVLRETNPALYSYPRIASLIGRKDHTTAMNLVRRWPELRKQYPDAEAIYQWAKGIR